MGIELIAVLPNPHGNDINALRGLEWELERRCPSLEKFQTPWLRRTVHSHETDLQFTKMKDEGRSETEIQEYLRDRGRSEPESDEGMTPEERAELNKRSWAWSRDELGWDEGYLGWDLDSRFLICFRFLPKILYISYPDKIGLQDADLRQRHLEVTRQVCRAIGVTEFLIVCDSCADNSEIYYGFPTEDFDYQKKWLRENLGPPQMDLGHMRVEYEEYYEIVGYYWEKLEDS